MNIAENMKNARKRIGYTQKELAKIAGVQVAIVCNLENGRTESRLSTIIKLADALGISIDEYIGRNAEKRDQSELGRYFSLPLD